TRVSKNEHIQRTGFAEWIGQIRALKRVAGVAVSYQQLPAGRSLAGRPTPADIFTRGIFPAFNAVRLRQCTQLGGRILTGHINQTSLPTRATTERQRNKTEENQSQSTNSFPHVY